MFVATIADGEVGSQLLYVLEPVDVEILKKGFPLVRELRGILPDLNIEVKLLLAYTPDAKWVEEQVGKGIDIPEAVTVSLARPPVMRVSSQNMEALAASPIFEQGYLVAEDDLGKIFRRGVTKNRETYFEFGFSLNGTAESIRWGYSDIDQVTTARRNEYGKDQL